MSPLVTLKLSEILARNLYSQFLPLISLAQNHNDGIPLSISFLNNAQWLILSNALAPSSGILLKVKSQMQRSALKPN